MSEEDYNFCVETKLSALTEGQIDHLSVGLENNFGALLGQEGKQTTSFRSNGVFLFTVMFESGKRIGFSTDCLVGDVWNVCKHEERINEIKQPDHGRKMKERIKALQEARMIACSTNVID